jgi:hypothetical protein
VRPPQLAASSFSDLRRPISPTMRSKASDGLSAPTSRAVSLNRSDCRLSLIFGFRLCFSPAFPMRVSKLQRSRGCYIKHRPPRRAGAWTRRAVSESPKPAGVGISPGISRTSGSRGVCYLPGQVGPHRPPGAPLLELGTKPQEARLHTRRTFAVCRCANLHTLRLSKFRLNRQSCAIAFGRYRHPKADLFFR